jgi:CHASE3 domain sensor protein
MAKKAKKRNKPYTGSDANRQTVTRITLEERSALQQWLHDNKRANKTRAVLALVALLVSWIIYTIIF